MNKEVIVKRRIKKKYWGKKVFSTILSAVLVFTCILPVMSFAQGDEGEMCIRDRG